jgi:hypothetical protein
MRKNQRPVSRMATNTSPLRHLRSSYSGRPSSRSEAAGLGKPLAVVSDARLSGANVHQVVERLLSVSGEDPKRVTTRPGRAVHLLSGIAVCDKCGGPIFATFRYEVASYQCRRGCIRIQKADIEELAEGVILRYLARPDVRADVLRPTPCSGLDPRRPHRS